LTTEEIITNSFEEEWDGFQPIHVLPPELSDKLWGNIHKNTASPAIHYPYFRWTAAAAAVLLVIGLSGHFILKKQTAGVITGAAVAKMEHVFNTTSQKMTLTLSDGSTVELLPGSTLSYPENFTSLNRDVVLNGEATFDIAKDAAKPFLVYSHSIVVTVLGTRFTINSTGAATGTKVILHEGRVVVKVSNTSSKDNKNEYYLAPGDIFLFGKSKKPAPVTGATPVSTQRTGSNDSLSARILHLEKDKDDCYEFDNYPLDVVFDQLQIIYNTRIIYNKAAMGNRTFIGKIDKRDPLYNILKSISLLNNFRLLKQGDGFLISD
jgi:transmembrane sensor